MRLIAKHLENLIAAGGDAVLTQGLRGIEKEGLRVTPEGRIAATPHPATLGKALTHPELTLDFGEAQIELVTSPYPSLEDALQSLTQLHTYTQQNLEENQIMWPLSMPCTIDNADEFQPAHFGSSNTGKIKRLYRLGLKCRYGNLMQSVSGVHYNFSFPPRVWEILNMSSDDGYLAVMRNFRRNIWTLIYLYGASPAVHSSFLKTHKHNLPTLEGADDYLGKPWASSLRLSDIGYTSDLQKGFGLELNSLDGYIGELRGAMQKVQPEFEQLGLRDAQGELQQINTNLLQLENELYGQIRAKTVPLSKDERGLIALSQRGIDYLEVRTLDLNPFSPFGLAVEQAAFLEILFWGSLLSESPLLDDAEKDYLRRDLDNTIHRGREPGLVLENTGQSIPDSGAELCRAMQPVAQALDEAHGGSVYRQALEAAAAAFADSGLCYAARVLQESRGDINGWGLQLATQYQKQCLEQTFSPEQLEHMRAVVEQSVANQAELERSETLPFEEHLQRFLNQNE